jgi:allantoicase
MTSSLQPPSFAQLTDLISERLGGKVLACSDDFFAEKENLIKPGRGVFIADKYTDRGKWMDGWESRRKRVPGNDWVIIALAVEGRVKGFDIDTNHFLGNHPPFASVEGIYFSETPTEETLLDPNAGWFSLLDKSPLNPGSQHFYESQSNQVISHIRLQIYPDGGVARFRVYGEPEKNWDALALGEEVDLAAAWNGGQAVLCNDMFFSHMGNLLMPGRGINMGDGWETKRNRTPGNQDWVIIQLGHAGYVHRLLVDTAHFKGNYPDRCKVEGCFVPAGKNVQEGDLVWQTILDEQKLSADTEHFFAEEIQAKGPFTHVKLTILPDGGVSRLRVFGTLTPKP